MFYKYILFVSSHSITFEYARLKALQEPIHNIFDSLCVLNMAIIGSQLIQISEKMSSSFTSIIDHLMRLVILINRFHLIRTRAVL
jgi:hypothetical protein